MSNEHLHAPTEEEFLKLYSQPKKMTEERLKAHIVELNRQLENYKLVASYAKDVIDFWPTMSIRLIRVMIPKMDNLKEALKLVK